MRAAELLPRENKPAPGDLRFVQAFVNTLDIESGRDVFAEVAGAERWLKAHCDLAPGTELSAQDLSTTVGFREALRVVLTEGQDDRHGALAVLDEVGRRGQLHLAVNDEERLELRPAGDGLDAALGRLLAVVHTAMQDGTWDRLKICAADECRWVFYDASKNRSGSWCSMQTCGNRAKVRVHRSKQRATEA